MSKSREAVPLSEWDAHCQATQDLLPPTRITIFVGRGAVQLSVTCAGKQSCSVTAGPTWLEMREGNFSGEELPQTQGVAEDICLDGVACALCEHLRGHPA